MGSLGFMSVQNLAMTEMSYLNRQKLALLITSLLCTLNGLAYASTPSWGELTKSGCDSVVTGDLPLAEKQLTAALKQAENFSTSDPRLTESLHNLASLYERMKRWDEAESLFLEELKIVEPLGEKYKDTLFILMALGRVSQARGRYAQAERFFRRGLAIAKNLPEARSRSETIRAVLWGIGHNCDLQGKYAEGEPFLLEASSLKAGPAATEPDTVRLCDEIAANLKAQRKFERAETYQKRAVQLVEFKSGPASVELIGYLIRLEYMYCDEGKYDRAEPLARRVLSIAGRFKSYDHCLLASHFTDLGNLCWRLKKNQEAISCYSKALAIYKRYDSHDYAAIGHVSCLLGNMYFLERKVGEAQSLYETATKLKEKAKVKDEETMQMLNALGDVYAKQKRPKDAEAAYKEALACQDSLVEPGNISLIDPLMRLANIYLSEHKPSSAQLLYKRALSLKTNAPSPRDGVTAFLLNRLGDTYANLGSDQKAEDLYKQAQTIWDELPSRNQSEQASGLLSLANLYARQQRFSLAEANYRRSLSMLSDVPKDHAQYVSTVQCYVGMLKGTNRNKEADRLMKQMQPLGLRAHSSN